MPERLKHAWAGLRLRGATGFAGWSTSGLALPDGLPQATAEPPARVLESRFSSDDAATERAWVLLCGLVLRMPSQPALRMLAHPGEAAKPRKLKNLCWVPPVATVVAHYTGREHSCDEVLERCGVHEDTAEDTLEMLSLHWGIECEAAYTDGASHSGGAPSGWEEEGGTAPLYEVRDGLERVVGGWWTELAAAIASGHPFFLLAERLEAETVRRCTRTGASYCHCLLVVGHEGSLAAGACGSDRRSRNGRGAAVSARLLVKDPCRADRILEASFESAGGAVQLHVFFEGGKHAFDRYRVRGTARFSGLESSRS